MVTIKSNIDKFLQNYRKRIESFKIILYNIANKLADKMIKSMKDQIKRDFYTWWEFGSYVEIEEFDNISFDITQLDETSIRIDIGKNLPLFEMSDGALVNPAFFIEFGFGIVGQNNPKKNHEVFNWEYNINGHTKGWVYMGRDGAFHGSKGKLGINFMYNAQQNAKKFLEEIMTEQGNGGV